MNSMSVNSIVTFRTVVDTSAAENSTEAADTPDIVVGRMLVGSTVAAGSIGVADTVVDIVADIVADTVVGTEADIVADTVVGTEADIVAGRLVDTPADKLEVAYMPAVTEQRCV